jgi:RNA polymerase subunit RPABC4/transcription elongation factor Spt4
MIFTSFVCEDCSCQFDDDIKVTECPECESSNIRKDWSRYSVSYKVDRGMKDGHGTILQHGALDDPLTAIELGVKERSSSLRTCNDAQVADLRQKALRGEDSARLRQEVLDIREKNINKFRAGGKK